MDLDRTVVTVKEGVVAVVRHRAEADQAAAAIDSVTLRVGEQVQISDALPMAVVAIDVSKELAWVEGWLVFDQETVAQAARAFNLRNRVQIKVMNPTLAEHQVRGRFRTADPTAFTDFLQRQRAAAVVIENDGTLLLQPNDSKPQIRSNK